MSLKSRKSNHLFPLGFVVLLLFTACGGTSEGGSKKDLSFEDAARLVMDEVVIPESLDHELIVFGLSDPLTTENNLAPYAAEDLSTPGKTLQIPAESWFFFIDDDPYARFVHETRFVMVDVGTGEITSSDQEWWPVLDGEGLWVDSSDYWDIDQWIYSNLEGHTKEYSALSPALKLARRTLNPLPQQEEGPNFALLINGWTEGQRGKESFADDITNMTEALDRSKFGVTSYGPGDSDIPTKINQWLDTKAEELQPGQTAMIYISSHGSNVDLLGVVKLGGQSYDELRLKERLLKFPPGVNIIVVIDACSSGSWIDGLQDEADLVLTGSGPGQSSYSDIDAEDDPNPEDSGGEFTSGFVEGWEEITASKTESDKARVEARRNGTNFWVEVAMMAYGPAVQKNWFYLHGYVRPMASRGNPQTTQILPIDPFADVVEASPQLTMQLVQHLETDGEDDEVLSHPEWLLDENIGSANVNFFEAFWYALDPGGIEVHFTYSYFDCGTQVGDVLTFCAPGAGLMPEGDVLVGLMVLNDDIPLDPVDEIYTYGFLLDSDNDPVNNYQYNPPFTMDYYQGTDIWYQVDNYAGHWELFVTNSQGADLQSNARAAIIKDILVYFVPANEIPADFPGYRFSAFGCAAGGFGSGYCTGDVSGVDPTVPPIPVSQEKVIYGE